MKKKIIAANWKMNPSSLKEAEKTLRAIIRLLPAKSGSLPKTIIIPPFLFLRELKAISLPSGFSLGAQDAFWEEKGAFTGETSPLQLKSAGVKYVVIGHSERRALGETDEVVGRKIKSVLRNGLTPILCVGENKNIRKKGLAAAKNFVGNELEKSLKNLPATTADRDFLIAYEPIWAISSVPDSKNDTPESAAEMIVFIKKAAAGRLKNLKVLYGGSVSARNAGGFLSQPEIDGVLIGGASLKVDEFAEIIGLAG